MGSTRLPGKVLRQIQGKPLLWHLLNRVGSCASVEKTVVATSTNPEDGAIEDVVRQKGVACFRGSENDVLDRYYRAARLYGADPIVRLTADCPLIDPRVVDEIVRHFIRHRDELDYVATDGTFPDGLDTEVFSFQTLERAWREAEWKSEREHVTPYIAKNPQRFRIWRKSLEQNLGRFRWTVDEPQDLLFVKAVYEALYDEAILFYMEDVLRLLSEKPELLEMNRHIRPNEGYEKSLREDEKVK